MYEVDYTDDALIEIAELKKSDIFAYRKFDRLLKELHEHPYSGTGKPKPLKYGKKGDWSRRITDKHDSYIRLMMKK
jgi:toxin YoeB